jgi:spermidine synthase
MWVSSSGGFTPPACARHRKHSRRARFLPARHAIAHADAVDFVRQHRGRFDLIVADTPDPVGIALPLFGQAFVADCLPL